MTDFSVLNERYGIQGQVVFLAGPGGLTIANVSNDQGMATIALQGAQVIAWMPRGQKPVIWLSPVAKFATGKSIRGGVPVCWPWFGPHATEASYPSHGFARTLPWEVMQSKAQPDGSTRLIFRLVPGEAERNQWPHATHAEMHITVGTALEIDLVTSNLGANTVTIGQALHTYFEVSDIRQTAIQGLDGSPYLDKTDGGKRQQQSGPVIINAETDRIYLNSTADCLIDDPGFKRRIRIAKRGSASTIVWNPWVEKSTKMGDFGDNGYLNMVCVESANAADDTVSVAPGGEHHLWVRYLVEPLGQL